MHLGSLRLMAGGFISFWCSSSFRPLRRRSDCFLQLVLRLSTLGLNNGPSELYPLDSKMGWCKYYICRCVH